MFAEIDFSFLIFEADVWSFGVVLWEVFSLGATPYEDMDAADVATAVCAFLQFCLTLRL